MLHRVALHIRVSPETRQRLQRLRTERHLNVGSWLRALIDEALDREFGPASTEGNELDAPVKAAASEPIPGWTPAKLKDGGWGARFQGDTRILPTDLEGLTIAVPGFLRTPGGFQAKAGGISVFHFFLTQTVRFPFLRRHG